MRIWSMPLTSAAKVQKKTANQRLGWQANYRTLVSTHENTSGNAVTRVFSRVYPQSRVY